MEWLEVHINLSFEFSRTTCPPKVLVLKKYMLVFSDSQSPEIFCRKAFLCAFEGLQYNGKLESPFPMGALSGCSISCVPCAQFRAKPRQPYLSLELGPTSRAPRGFREQERCQKWISDFFCLFPFQSLMGRGWRGLVPTHTNTNKHICKVMAAQYTLLQNSRA